MKILVIGASARAAAKSARRAGFAVAALDLFADRDLGEISECEVIERYPESIVEQAKRWPHHSILLAGGMENHPEIVAALQSNHAMIGPDAAQMRVLRSREQWIRWVAELGSPDWLRFPTTKPEKGSGTNSAKHPTGRSGYWCLTPFPDRPHSPDSERWLWKSSGSAGGMQVFPANLQARDIPSNGYLQRYIDGPVLGITFCCSPNNTSILGVMRNISLQEYIDKAVLASQQRPFLYAGSIGPFPIDTVTAQRLTDWVDKVALSIDYRGILQADFILGESGHLYLLEFNPRWTSSMELVEFVSGRNLIREHLSAQLGKRDRMTLPDHDARSSGFEAIKKIIYAVRELFISQACSDAMMANSNWPLTWDDCHGRVAGWSDIPHPGTRVEAGSPIATAWAIRSLAEQDFALTGKSSNLEPPQDWPEIDELLQSTPIELE